MILNCLVLGTTEFTRSCVEGLIASEGINVIGIVSLPKEDLPLNSLSLETYSKDKNIHYFEFVDINTPEFCDLLEQYSIDILFSTWPKILKEKTLSSPKLCTIGTHPTDLPTGRGRHPIHWLINLGAKSSMLTFFKMDKNIDSGKIIHKENFCIDPYNPIKDSNSNMCEAALIGIPKVIKNLRKNILFDQEGDVSLWRARTLHDCLIDPRMSGESIIQLVNSFSPPYPCAKLVYKERVYNIESAKTLLLKSSDQYRYSIGTIIDCSLKEISIRCGDGYITLSSRDDLTCFEKNKDIHPPSYYLMKNFDKLRMLF